MNRRSFLTLSTFGLASLSASTGANAANGPNVGLIFVGMGSCPYCAQIAPILYNLEYDAGVSTLVTSLDNQQIAPFPNFVDGRQHPLSAQFTRVPNILIYNSGRDEITHILSNFRSPQHFVNKLALALRQSSEMAL
ncbi:MAG: conjugal transfer protein TraF [Pseudoruegeria sp.]